MGNAANERTRLFGCLVYPDSAPEDWVTILREHLVYCYISPLHDKDVFERDIPDLGAKKGDLKKPHYHVLFKFDGPKSEKQVREIFDTFKGQGCEKIKSWPNSVAYLCHLNDKDDKAQYDPAEVLAFNGADFYTDIAQPAERYSAIGEMMDFCEKYDIFSYRQLILWTRSNRPDWFRVLCDSGTYVMKEYLKSRSWDFQNNNTSDLFDLTYRVENNISARRKDNENE